MLNNCLLKVVHNNLPIILTSVILAVTSAFCALIYPISNVAILKLSNDQKIFSLSGVKEIRQQLSEEAKYLITLEKNPNLRSLYIRTINNPDWIEKNIIPVYSITKSDVKDILDYKSDNENQVISFLQVQVSAKNGYDIESFTKWLALEINRLNYINRLKKYLMNIKEESSLKIENNYTIINENIVSLSKLKVVDIANQNIKNSQLKPSFRQPDSKNDFSTNLEIGQNKNVSSLAYLSLILPDRSNFIKRSIDFLERNIKSLDEYIFIDKEIKNFAHNALSSIVTNTYEQKYLSEPTLLKIWENVFDDINKTNISWDKDYFNNRKNSYRVSEESINQDYDLQLKRTMNVSIEQKYNRVILIIIAFILGLIFPPVVIFIIRTLGNAKNNNK